MTVSERMKNPINSFDVFEFKEEAELDEITVQNPDFKFEHPDDQEDVSFPHIESEDFAKEGPGFSHVTHHDCKNREQAAVTEFRIHEPGSPFASVDCGSSADADQNREQAVVTEFRINESGSAFASADCGSSEGPVFRLEDDSNGGFKQSAFNDMTARLALEDDEYMNKRSTSAISDADVSFPHIETEDIAKEGPNFSHVTHHDFQNREQAEVIEFRINESGSAFASADCGSSEGPAFRLEDDSNGGFNQSAFNDMTARLALEDDEYINKRSTSAIANNNAFSDGPLVGNCSSDWNLGDEKVGIIFYPDYVKYCGTHFLDSVVNFSRSNIEVRSINTCGDERNFQIHLETEDIVKIESQWNAQYETGIINIYFISNERAQEGRIYNDSAKKILELKFAVVDPDWYKKQEAIEALDVRYKELWNAIFDSGMEKIPPLPERISMMRTKNYFPKFDKPFEGVIYPKGDPDAVSISKRDADLLLPETFVNDTIIDFYIKYLKSNQNVVGTTKFHFFNSFFFRKLADMDKDPSSIFDGKAAFQRVRKWTRKINLLEKDFIFIPVNYNYHWSLLVICYFGEVVSYKDDDDGKSLRVPCILHMDSLVGNHVGLKDLLQSYLWEEWKERHKETSEDLHSNFKSLKFIPLELPQQQNSYDCGLFLLHYVELFLKEVPTNFSIYQITSSSNFLQADWFPPGEASMKRTRIERLINDLLDTQSEDCPPFNGKEMHRSPEGLKAIHGHDNGVGFSIKSNPTSAFRENLMHQVDQGIELTLLPASSSRGTHCNKTSGLVLKELFEQASVPEPFNDASSRALGNRASLPEEEDEEANECFVQEELSEPVFRHIDDVTIDEPVFPDSSEYFRLNSLDQPTPDHVVSSSPLTSGSESDDDIVEVEADEDENGLPVEAVTVNHDKLDNHKYSSQPEINEHPNAEKSCTFVGINNLVVDESLSFKEFCEEKNQLQRDQGPPHDGLSLGPALASEDDLGVVMEIVLPRDEARLDTDGPVLALEFDEQRSAKRMKIGLQDCVEEENCTNHLSEDLNF